MLKRIMGSINYSRMLILINASWKRLHIFLLRKETHVINKDVRKGSSNT